MLDHVSLSDPLTWLGVLVASFLIAGLRFLLRGGGRDRAPPVAEAEDKAD